MIKGVKFASIPFVDQSRALAFYTERLGFVVKVDASFGPQRWLELGIPGADTMVVIFNTDEGPKAGGTMNITFWSDDVEATAAEMAAKGVEIVEGPTKESWGTFAVFKDSEGNQFVLSSKS